MDIKIRITNALTGQVEKDFTAKTVDSVTAEAIEYMHDGYKKGYPDSHVNFIWDDGKSFIFGVPYNMSQDEIAYEQGRMTWKQYCEKWYKGALSGCNEDDSENDFKFTFETEAELWKAQATGYIDEYDCVRVEVKHAEGGSTDFPVKSREELANIIERHGSAIVKIYPTVHSYDVMDYL